MKTFNSFCLFSLLVTLLACGESSENNQFKPLNFDGLTLSAEIPGPTFTTLHDLNGDGFNDIILSVFNKPEGTLLTPGEIRVLYGTGDVNRWNEVTVLPQSEEIYFPNDVVVEDMDEDGDLDLLVGSGFLPCPVLERLDSNGEIQPAQPQILRLKYFQCLTSFKDQCVQQSREVISIQKFWRVFIRSGAMPYLNRITEQVRLSLPIQDRL